MLLAFFALATIVEAPRPLAAADRVELDSGEVFQGRILRLAVDRIEIELDGGGRLALPRDRVRKFRLSVTSRVRDEREAAEPRNDRDDEAAGRSSSLRSPPRGNDRDSPIRKISRLRGGRAVTPSTRARGSALSPAARDTDPDRTSTRHESRQPPVPARSSPRGSEEARAPAVISTPAGLDAADDASATPVPTAPAGSTVSDRTNGMEFVLPRGFKRWSEGETSPVVHAFRDAVSGATLTVSVYSSKLPVGELKRRAARAYSNIYREFRVTRNEEVAGFPGEAWLLEINTRLAGVALYQLQFFTVHDGQAIVFNFSATSDKYFAELDSFLGTLQSLRFGEPATSRTEE